MNNNNLITIKEAAAVLNISVQSIYKSKKYSPYIQTIDNKKYIDKEIILNDINAKEEKENKADVELSKQLYNIIELLEGTIKAKEEEIKELRKAIKEKDDIIKDLSFHTAETNDKLAILLKMEQDKNALNLLNDGLKKGLNDGLKPDNSESNEKPRRKRFLGIF